MNNITSILRKMSFWIYWNLFRNKKRSPLLRRFNNKYYRIACSTRFLWNLSKAQDDESCSWLFLGQQTRKQFNIPSSWSFSSSGFRLSIYHSHAFFASFIRYNRYQLPIDYPDGLRIRELESDESREVF